jgi:hypothetical protein
MYTLSEEQLNVEWSKFVTMFKELGLAEHYDMEKMYLEMKDSPCAVSLDMGTAYKGALLVHINMLTAIAQRLSKMISGTFKIDEKSLYKVCVLMHLSKRNVYVENDNDWEVKNRGLAFKFKKDVEGCINGGARSALEALNNGVKLTPTEFEAIQCLDNETEACKRIRNNIMTTVIRQANELAYAISREKYKKTQQN